MLALFAVVAAPLTATPSAMPGVGPLTAYANPTDVDQHENQGNRPPSGPVVPTPPDDGALLTAAPAATDSTWLPVSHSVEVPPGVSFSRDRSYDAGGMDPSKAKVNPDLIDPKGFGWFQADVRPVLTRLELHAPEQAEAGTTAQVTANAIDEGQGGRNVPLRYPMSVTWTGDTHLAVVRDDHDLSPALQNPHVVAVLDIRSGTLTGVHTGTVQITVRAGAMSASANVQVN